MLAAGVIFTSIRSTKGGKRYWKCLIWYRKNGLELPLRQHKIFNVQKHRIIDRHATLTFNITNETMKKQLKKENNDKESHWNVCACPFCKFRMKFFPFFVALLSNVLCTKSIIKRSKCKVRFKCFTIYVLCYQILKKKLDLKLPSPRWHWYRP